MPVFSSVLVANRGEIAIRVFRTLRELGLRTIAVYSDADRDALHAAAGDEAHRIGPGPASESYLDQERLIDVALLAGAGAVHPGYGFLAESAAFARRCLEAGLVWIGPPPDAIEAMGSKIAARELMASAGVPIIPGTTEPVDDVAGVVRLGDELGWPIAIKAAAGGGGRGLKVVSAAADAERALESARREGLAYFADATVYVEKYIPDPRHVEVQVLADAHGNVVQLGERDCTIQRRHQKLVEEAPSPAVDEALRARIGAIALEAARAVGYVSAGTVEGLLDANGDYWFLEMNTRIQVEHTITELVTGIDLVREQVLIAQGAPLSFRQEDVVLRGHAIECRVNAEDPSTGFLPSPGVITRYREPGGPGVRVDSGVREGSEISGLYDPMIAKLCVWDTDRERARLRMLRALGEMVVEGVESLVGFHRALLEHDEFVAAGTCHGLVESEALAARARELGQGADGRPSAVVAGAAGRTRDRQVTAEVDGRRYAVTLHLQEAPHAELMRARRERVASADAVHGGGAEAVRSPMQGTVLAVEVANGDQVHEGQVVCIVEAMKMENEIVAHRAGVVSGLGVGRGDRVRIRQVICVIGDAAP